MGFAPVKSSKWGIDRAARVKYLWSERKWKKLVRAGLLSIDDVAMRVKIAKIQTYSFKAEELIRLA